MRVLRYWRLGLGAAIALSASVAFATDPVSPYPVCTRKASAADQDGAKGAHKAASQFYDRGDYEKAIRYWTDAYSFDCNAHGVLINIANAYEKKGEKASAVLALETYLKRAPADSTIEEKVKNLKASLATAPPPTATAPTTTAPTGSSSAPPPPPPPVVPDVPTGPRPFGMTPLLVAGGGGVLAIVGAIVLPIGLGNVSAAEELCPLGVNKNGKTVRDCGGNTEAESQGNTGRAQVGAGGALLGIGVAAAAGGLIWQFAFNKPKPLAPGAPPKTSLQVLPTVSPNASGITLTGTF